MTGSTSGAGSSACTVKGGGGSGGRRGVKRSFGTVWGRIRGMTGSAPAQGVPTAAVKVVGGSGGGGTNKVGLDCFLCRFSVFFKLFQISKKPVALQRRIVF